MRNEEWLMSVGVKEIRSVDNRFKFILLSFLKYRFQE